MHVSADPAHLDYALATYRRDINRHFAEIDRPLANRSTGLCLEIFKEHVDNETWEKEQKYSQASERQHQYTYTPPTVVLINNYTNPLWPWSYSPCYRPDALHCYGHYGHRADAHPSSIASPPRSTQVSNHNQPKRREEEDKAKIAAGLMLVAWTVISGIAVGVFKRTIWPIWKDASAIGAKKDALQQDQSDMQQIQIKEATKDIQESMQKNHWEMSNCALKIYRKMHDLKWEQAIGYTITAINITAWAIVAIAAAAGASYFPAAVVATSPAYVKLAATICVAATSSPMLVALAILTVFGGAVLAYSSRGIGAELKKEAVKGMAAYERFINALHQPSAPLDSLNGLAYIHPPATNPYLSNPPGGPSVSQEDQPYFGPLDSRPPATNPDA